MKKVGKFAAALVVMAAAIGMMGCAQPSGGSEEGSTGFLEGAGTVAKAKIEIANIPYEKTGEVVIIPAGKKAVINMKDDSSWNTFVTPLEYESYWKGVFIKDRKVTLSPFVMSQYEVTQELYNAVMGSNPSSFSSSPATGETQKYRPVECVSHYEAVAFCNELTKKTMKASDVVYFSDEEKKTAYTTTDATNEKIPYMDITKKGYRLPTEAEWEYAARGGNPQAADWKNAFGKVTTKDNAKVYDGINYLEEDENLATVGWYYGNSSNKTHEVGLKEKNSLNLYDMQGNVWEWCWDWYGDVTTGTAADPVGAASGSYRCIRGGGWGFDACYCAVSRRGDDVLYDQDSCLGFRMCRSSSN